jgi:hypothetical protein
MKTRKLYNLKQVAKMIGYSYWLTWRAVDRGIVEPWQAGRSRLFEEKHVETLRAYFAEKYSPDNI